jgi:hypothetical protein
VSKFRDIEIKSAGDWLKVSSADIFEIIEHFMAQQSRSGKS